MLASSFQEYHQQFRAEVTRKGGSVRTLANDGTIATFGTDGPVFALMSGLHGDERSGPLAILEWLQHADLSAVKNVRFWICPLVNDDGWDQQLREWHGQDLNRSFLPDKATPFLKEIMLDLQQHPADLFLDLHEDSDVPFSYVFRHPQDPHNVSTRIAKALSVRALDWEPEVEWDGCSEVYAHKMGCPRCLVTEAQPLLPLHERIQWNQKAIEWCAEEMATCRDNHGMYRDADALRKQLETSKASGASSLKI